MTTSTTWVGRMLASIKDVFEHEAWPFIEGLWHKIQLDEQAVLAPLVQEAIADSEQVLVALLTKGTQGAVQAFNTLLPAVWQKAEAAARNVAYTDLITATHAGIVNLEAKVAAAAPKAP